jgi:hypothetical protein
MFIIFTNENSEKSKCLSSGDGQTKFGVLVIHFYKQVTQNVVFKTNRNRALLSWVTGWVSPKAEIKVLVGAAASYEDSNA